jgi:hypothetical protein
MKKKEVINILTGYFDFLISDCNFKLNEVESSRNAIYANFISDKVGLFFDYEFRDFVPMMQVSLLNSSTPVLSRRPGLYNLIELYKTPNFKLQSFYLDEILLYKSFEAYPSYFKDIKTIEDAIATSADLLRMQALEFIKGVESSYSNIDEWFKMQVAHKKV